MYYFVKMSSGWYGKKISDIASYEYDLQEYVNGGEIVVLTDDIDGFAEEIGISVDDITMA